jgi:uncharacterized protein YceH (UPF0502 family)
MKGSGLSVVVVFLAFAGALSAQTKAQRVPAGTGQKESLFEGRQSPEVEKRIRISETKVQTQEEIIRKLEARVKELEAELAALKAGTQPAPVAAP